MNKSDDTKDKMDKSDTVSTQTSKAGSLVDVSKDGRTTEFLWEPVNAPPETMVLWVKTSEGMSLVLPRDIERLVVETACRYAPYIHKCHDGLTRPARTMGRFPESLHDRVYCLFCGVEMYLEAISNDTDFEVNKGSDASSGRTYE